MKLKLSDLWTWHGTVDRGAYLFWGIALAAVKFALDFTLVNFGFGGHETIGAILRLYLWQEPMALATDKSAAMLAVVAMALPFVWFGTALTLRRLRAIGWTPWLVL